MLEYVLFSETIRSKFVTWLEENGIASQLAGDEKELLVLIDEDIDEDIEDKIEVQYDLLLDENAKIINSEDQTEDAKHLVGIQFTNKNGEIGNIHISPELANKIQECLTAEELQAFVQVIADEVMNPVNKSLCQTQ